MTPIGLILWLAIAHCWTGPAIAFPSNAVKYVRASVSVSVTSKHTSSKTAKVLSLFESMSAQERQKYCDNTYPDLYTNLGQELRHWNKTGITVELMQDTIKVHTLRSSGSMRKGFAAGFRAGRAVLLDKPRLTSDLAHHVALMFLYMQALLDLEQLFGSLIPDVDFVISTIDRPLLMAYESSKITPQPVMRFCKTPSHSDILIPIFHFMMKGHGNDLGTLTNRINTHYPWDLRKPTLFGRFSLYERHMHPHDPHTPRVGYNKSNICDDFSRSVTSCTVRAHFINYTRNYPRPVMDVGTAPRIPMIDHASFKYLVHLDGQGLSSRLDQLLSLGSLIFKEESGYYAFYHHLLKPYEHYIPFWKEVPEEVLDALDWARKHDDKAKEIGEAAQQVATKYLSREARACYWFRLLNEYSHLLKYKPSKVGRKRYMKYQMPIRQYLETEAVAWEGGRQLRRYPYSP